MSSQGLRHIFVLYLERLDKLVCNFAIFGHLKLDLFLQSAIAGRLHVYLSAELLFFLSEIAPLWVVLEVLTTVYFLILAHSLGLLAALTAARRT